MPAIWSGPFSYRPLVYKVTQFIINSLLAARGPVLDNDEIFVCVDRLMKMAHFVSCTSDVTTEQAAQLYCRYVWKHHGLCIINQPCLAHTTSLDSPVECAEILRCPLSFRMAQNSLEPYLLYSSLPPPSLPFGHMSITNRKEPEQIFSPP